ncbi:MAG: hypothetical protein AB9891_12120 [Anaerolineaceae bacterium]
MRIFCKRPKIFLFSLILTISITSCIELETINRTNIIETTQTKVTTNQSFTNEKTTFVPTITVQELITNESRTPSPIFEKGEITLYTNGNLQQEKLFPIENLVNSDNKLAFFDFDQGEINNSKNTDIYLMVDCGSDCFNHIINLNNTKSVEVGEKEPGLSGCQIAMQGKKLGVTLLTPSNYSCIETNSGNIVQFLPIHNEARWKNAILTFQYTIWHQN